MHFDLGFRVSGLGFALMHFGNPHSQKWGSNGKLGCGATSRVRLIDWQPRWWNIIRVLLRYTAGNALAGFRLAPADSYAILSGT